MRKQKCFLGLQNICSPYPIQAKEDKKRESGSMKGRIGAREVLQTYAVEKLALTSMMFKASFQTFIQHMRQIDLQHVISVPLYLYGTFSTFCHVKKLCWKRETNLVKGTFNIWAYAHNYDYDMFL